MKLRQVSKVFAFDIDPVQREKFVQEFICDVDVIPLTAKELSKALRESQVCITCTPSKQPFIRAEDIMPGTFIAAVGADSEDKQELYPELFSSCKIVVDLAEQSASIGELHHAIKEQKITLTDIHSELGQIIAGIKPGRESEEEIIIFDSTGTALQDVAAAVIVYEKAITAGVGMKIDYTN